jgi:hypothetical protein
MKLSEVEQSAKLAGYTMCDVRCTMHDADCIVGHAYCTVGFRAKICDPRCVSPPLSKGSSAGERRIFPLQWCIILQYNKHV